MAGTTPGPRSNTWPTSQLEGRVALALVFPVNYRFSPDGEPPNRTAASKWVGNAAPVHLGYAAALSAIGPAPHAECR